MRILLIVTIVINDDNNDIGHADFDGAADDDGASQNNFDEHLCVC